MKPMTDTQEPDLETAMKVVYQWNYDAEIECIPTCLAEGEEAKYDMVRAGDYLKARFTSAVNA